MKKKVVIFGCGFHGRAVFRKCISLKKKYEVICWVDNDNKKNNKSLFGKKIFKPENLKKIDYDLIILSGRNVDLQKKQIQKITKVKKYIAWGNSQIKPQKKVIIQRDKSLKIILKYMINILEKNKILYWADSSALLTLCRKESLSIRSDFDISIDAKYLQTIKSIFKSNKYFRFYKIITPSKKIKLFFESKNDTLEYEPAIVDICFKIFTKKRYVYNYGNLSKKYPKSFFVNFINYKHLGLIIKIPSFYKKYLIYLYGDWKKKKEFFNNKLASKKKYLHQPHII